MMCFALRASQEPEPVNPMVDPADIRGLVPPYVLPPGACLTRGTRMPAGLFTLSRVTPHQGGVACHARWPPPQLDVEVLSAFGTEDVTGTW